MAEKRGRKYKVEIDLVRTPGEVIVIRRKSLGWSQDELGERSGVSTTQISRIERGLTNPSYETIEKLEQALEIDLFDLFIKYRRTK